MAKQRKSSGNRKPVDTSSVETSLFQKGMIKDMNASFQGEQVWSHARNAYNNSHQGDVGVIGNEPSNFNCANILYTIIGAIHLYADKWVIFSTDDFVSEIGLFDDSECEYELLVNDNLAAGCLSFNKDYLIKGASKENFDCTWQVYWDDGKNPSRTLNINNIPWEQVVISPPGADCIEYEDTDILDCEKLRLAPLLDTPCVKLSKADDGGQLRNGGYQAFVAYTVNEQRIGDFVGISNFQSIFDHNDTSGALIVDITDLDQDFDYYELVIVSNNQQEIQAKRIGLYSTQQSRVHLDYINQKLESIPLEIIPLRNPAYEKSDSMYVVNDWLIRSGPTEQFDFNYQPLANEITTKWVSAEYPVDYYYNGGNKPTFMRDEVYAFFIRWIYNTGERSSSYHIPGRMAGTFEFPTGGSAVEDSTSGGLNTIELLTPEFNFIKWNTASVEVDLGNNTVDYSEPTDDGGVVTKKGIMAYWQSTEIYPADKPDIWGDLCGTPIRHHKMPDESTHGSTALASTDGRGIKVLGVEFSNIQIPVDNGDPDAGIPGSPIPNVVGYEILRGSREGNKSILAKGIIKNMRKYTIPGSQDIEQGGQHQVYDPTTGTWNNEPFSSTKGLYPNFPYNDLRSDEYHTEAPTTGCSYTGTSLDDVSHTAYTFHSPDLMFRVPHLNPYECRLYTAYSGQSTGHFIPSEEHPKHKLLKNGGALLAIIVGAGYAMAKFRGKRQTHYRNAVPSSIGYWGMGQGVGAAPIIGPAANPLIGNPVSVIAQTAVHVALDLIETTLLSGLWFGLDVFSGGTATEIERLFEFRASTGLMESVSPGYHGGSKDQSVESSAWGELPVAFKVMNSIFNFILYTTEGGQEVIDLIYNFVNPAQFGYKYNSHGFYQKASRVPVTGMQFRSRLNSTAYLNNSYQSFGKEYKINNLFRPKTVAIDTLDEFLEVSDPTIGPIAPQDTSRFTIRTSSSDVERWLNPGDFTKRPISAWYAGLKFSFQNQYGQLDGIRQIPMKGCILSAPLGIGQPTSSGHIFGGDCYVNRYTEKCIMPIFWDFLKGQPDNFPFDYRGHVNIPFPRYWMNTEKYHLSNMVSGFFEDIANNLAQGNVSGYNQQDLSDTLPRDLFHLDWETAHECNNLWQLRRPTKHSLFNVKYAYMYTHVNGINDFFVESEINIAQRDWEEEQGKKHFDWQEYGDYDELFHANIIKKGNFYKYDYSLSISRFWSNLISFGNIQPTDYDPFVAETCFKYYPKRLIYSLQAQKEAKKDFWRVFLPQNYKDFKSKVNVIKPVSKSGALVLFPYLSPQVFDGVQRLETVDAATTLTIGDGGLFSQPFQNVVNSDLSNEYGSCESMRSVINTPSGLFFISQAQGKVFNYTGRGLENIANRGMKWWFNEYLPSFLMKQYPELEGHTLGDNPVAGIGCQAIYDPNDDIVYFCKTDYKVKDKYSNGSHALDGEVYFDPDNGFCFQSEFVPSPPGDPPARLYGQNCIPIDIGDPLYFDNCSWTVSYDPKAKAWISFHDWHPELCLPSINHFMTTKKQLRDRISCPPGYYWQGTICVKTFTESLPALVEVLETEPLVDLPPNPCIGGLFEFCQTCGDNPDDLVNGSSKFVRFAVNANTTHKIGKLGSTYVQLRTGLIPSTGVITGAPGTFFDKLQIVIDPSSLTGGSGYLSVPVVGAATTGGSGTGLTVDITCSAGEVQTVVINNPGVGYYGNDLLTIQAPGSNNDATVRVSRHEFLGNLNAASGILYDDGTLLTSSMTEGQNVGPLIEDGTGTGNFYSVGTGNQLFREHQHSKWYYNTDIEKYVIVEDPGQTGAVGSMQWVTFDPKRDEGLAIGNPTASQFLTTSSNWSVVGYQNQSEPDTGGSNAQRQFTVNGAMKIVLAKNHNLAFPKMIQCYLNSDKYNGFYSVCSFTDYTHEVTLGVGNSNDNDKIGIVLSAFKDVAGIYGAVNQTHMLSMVMRKDANGPNKNNVEIQYNIGQNTCGFSDFYPNPNTGSVGTDPNPPTQQRSTVLRKSPNPFANNTSGYRFCGNVRFKIQKTGSRFEISCTKSMGDKGPPAGFQSSAALDAFPLGTVSNPYIPIFDFYLDDPLAGVTPWGIGSGGLYWSILDPLNTGTDGFYADFARGDELEKFIELGRIGYLTFSQPGTQFFDITFSGEQVSNGTCECPEGFTKVYLDESSSPPEFTLEEGICDLGQVMCRKVECECPPPTYDGSGLDTEGFCDNVYEVYTPGGTGDPGYVNLEPLTCIYTYEDQVPPTKDFGSIWKHNFRCDSFGNYYYIQYPWEIELIETTGQAVNMLRSVEYQLESYVYKGNLEWNCGDRWHDLDWNFDEAIIYNTEQVSGLLKFNILPKGDPITALQYPIIGTVDIQILYTKEEQKYRFNQFWDITEDRGEFTAVERQIFITQLNGYIKDLNAANLNYNKPPTQRKKFRHYYNKVLLRSVDSQNRKMLLKLVNTKLNYSFR